LQHLDFISGAWFLKHVTCHFIGNLGGGTPIAIIAVALAGRSAEIFPISPTFLAKSLKKLAILAKIILWHCRHRRSVYKPHYKNRGDILVINDGWFST
jgi:hypothetical protein